MRSVSFVEHLKLSVSNNVLHDCIALGDINNDGQNELVVVDSCGNLQIFKGSSTDPIFEIGDLGDTTCIEIGDIYGIGRNSILVFSSDGQCTIINIYKGSADDGIKYDLKTFYILSNIMNVTIKDIDGDGRLELLTCHSDLCVSAYRWNDKVKDVVLLQRWKVKHPMGNITVHTYQDGTLPSILVSQPGCSYAVLHVDWLKNRSNESKTDIYEDYVQYKPLSSRSRQQNPAISCKIIGDITKAEGEQNGYYSLCTLDGTIKLIEEDKILWSLHVDHHLFAVNKVDVLDDNREEVIMCAWDGRTYIVDHDKNIVRFHFQDNVQAFCSGKYSANGKDNLPCLVYGDFHKQIWLYYNVKLPYLQVTDLLTLAEKDEEIIKIFKEHNLTTLEEKQAMVRHCLYHAPSVNEDTNNDGQDVETRQD